MISERSFIVFIEILKAFFIGIVEGITEWLPVSSTGHIILVEQLIKLNVTDAFKEMFEVVIQLGAIMAVVVLYFKKLNPFSSGKTIEQKHDTWQLWFKVLAGCVPAAIIGFLFDDKINELFFNQWTVAATLIIYGIIFIIIERFNKKREPKIKSLSQLTYKTAFIIGFAQVLAMIPGTSRSGITIIAAILIGTSRYIAAEFTFFLAVPTMAGASLYKALKYIASPDSALITGTEIAILIAGIAVSFIVSILAIKFLMGYIKKHDFTAFGWYRIALGIVVIIYFLISHANV